MGLSQAHGATPGATDHFSTASILGECKDTQLYGKVQYKMIHKGVDDWCMEEVNVKISDGSVLVCKPGDIVRLNNDDVYLCSPLPSKPQERIDFY